LRFDKYILFVVLLAFTYLLIFPAVTIASSPGIRINGELRCFSPGAQIINNRTMVPVRFVVEDEALQGEVFWDASLRKVAMNCLGKYIEMFIGSNEAWVDGEKRFLDSPPYILDDRTFIPLRFLSENLGAIVDWDTQNSEVLISFKYQPRVFAYYYRSFAEYQENIDIFSDVAFRWFETNGRGELFYEYQDRFAEALDLARSKGVKTHVSVVLMGKDALHQLLSNPENRARLIANLLDVVKKDRYDGVNIDFELLDPGDAVNFLRLLLNRMGFSRKIILSNKVT
jgi:spore germination protein